MLYIHNGHFFDNPMTISAFVQYVRRGYGIGAIPHLQGEITNYLGTRDRAIVQIGNERNLTSSFGLNTCASVIYMSTHPHAPAVAYVHHANAGHLSDEDITVARDALGNPPWNTILVIFAHPRPTDNGYVDSLQNLINHGIPDNNIVEIAELSLSNYGINNLGQIG